MKKLRIILFIIICTIGLASCSGSNTLDYQVLVNKAHKISEEYINDAKLVDVINVYGDTIQVEQQTYDAYCNLHDALLEKGVEIGIDSGYRSVEEQKSVMAEFIEKYGEEYAKKTVAEPGTSEHHTGLVVDIVPKVDGEWIVENEDMLKQTAIFATIHEMLPEYGFILRYPKGKEDITGYDYEAWHLRYVGNEVAQEIYTNQLTLEEYI